jgi:hypothetical protein
MRQFVQAPGERVDFFEDASDLTCVRIQGFDWYYGEEKKYTDVYFLLSPAELLRLAEAFRQVYLDRKREAL